MSIVALQLLVLLSENYIASGAADSNDFQTMAALAVKGHFAAFNMGMLALSVGSLMFCYLLYRSKLIPRIISIIGLIGYAALFASGCFGIIGFDVGMVLYIPGAIFEIIFPIWLIAKGFNLSAIDGSGNKKITDTHDKHIETGVFFYVSWNSINEYFVGHTLIENDFQL